MVDKIQNSASRSSLFKYIRDYGVTPEGNCRCPKGRDCPSPGKHPRDPQWQHGGTDDLQEVARWLAEGDNAGILTAGFIVVDVDPRRGGLAWLQARRAEHGPFDTRIHKSGALGYHIIYLEPPGVEVRNSASKIAPGIDIKATGGQIVAPGSRHKSGEFYKVLIDRPPATATAWLLEEIQRAPAESPTAPQERPYFPPASAQVLDAARQALEQHGLAIEGEGGDSHTFRGCALLTHDFALTRDEAWNLLKEWNTTCSPPWSEEDLRAKLAHGEKYGTGPYGSRRPADTFATVMQIIDEWEREGTPPGASEAARAASMARMVAKVQAIRWDKGEKGQRGIVLQRLKAVTGLGPRDLDLPKPVDLQALARAEQRQEQAAAGRGDFSDRNAPLDIARQFLDSGRDAEGMAELVRWRGDWYRAKGTHYEVCGEEEIKGECYRWLDRRYDVTTGAPLKPDDSLVRSVLDALKGEAAI